MSDLSLFLGQMLRKPARVVAMAPSSARLAAMMAAQVDPALGPVAELGPGTGVITRALLSRGVAPADLTLFELDPGFAAHLHRDLPDLDIRECGAQNIADNGLRPLGAVVSGLRLLSMSLPLQRAIVSGAFACLKPGGVFVQFTYGTRPPVARLLRHELGLRHSRSRRVWRNMPPATVYTFCQG